MSLLRILQSAIVHVPCRGRRAFAAQIPPVGKSLAIFPYPTGSCPSRAVTARAAATSTWPRCQCVQCTEMSASQAEPAGSASAQLLAAARAGQTDVVDQLLGLAPAAGEESLDVPTPTNDSP